MQMLKQGISPGQLELPFDSPTKLTKSPKPTKPAGAPRKPGTQETLLKGYESYRKHVGPLEEPVIRNALGGMVREHLPPDSDPRFLSCLPLACFLIGLNKEHVRTLASLLSTGRRPSPFHWRVIREALRTRKQTGSLKKALEKFRQLQKANSENSNPPAA